MASPGPVHSPADDERFLREAIRLSREHMLAGHGGPFGAVVVREGRVVAEGWNQVTTRNDPTAHAEVVAIRQACGTLGQPALAGHTLYSSCEPCPMCLAAIYWARLDRLVFAASRQDAAGGGFDDDFLYLEVPKPLEERTLSTTQMLRSEGAAVFAEWLGKADRVLY